MLPTLLTHDVRDAFRALRATPAVTTVAVLSLALGIGANTAIFSILNSLVLRSLPVEEPARLVQLILTPAGGGSWTNPQWEQIRNRPDLFDGMFAWSSLRFDLAGGGQSEFVNGLYVSGGFFEVLGVRPVLGRTLGSEDDRRGGGAHGPAVVISHSFWQRRYGGAVDVIGRPLAIDRVSCTIAGVTPPEFTGPDIGRSFDVALAIGAEPLLRGRDSYLDARSTWWLNIMARLKPGQTLETAQAALRGVQPQIREATIPPNYRPEHQSRYLSDPFSLRPAGNGPPGLRQRYQQPLVIMMVAVSIVLLIACANLANLLLARATARRHELSVRLALGATRWRLARQLLAESLLLSAAGALAGLLFALWGSRTLVAQLSTGTNVVHLDVSLDWSVLSFTLAVSVMTAVLFGTAPAFRASRVQPNDGLKDQARTLAGESRFSIGSILVAGQVTLSLVLVVAAGLFVRTFVSLRNVPLGFEPDPIVIVDLTVRRAISTPDARAELFERTQQAVQAVPGVASVGLSSMAPIGGIWNTTLENPDGVSLSERERETYVNRISVDWLKTYGTDLIAGRDISDVDRKGTPPVILVNETFARRFFPDKNPLGRRIREIGPPGRTPPEREIVGVVRDAIYSSVRETVPPTMYLALAQEDLTRSFVKMSVRATAGSPASLTRSIADAIGRVDKDIALTFTSLSANVRAHMNQERLVAMLAGFFGGLAILLAAVGLYGMMAYSVGRRWSEIGLRVALGASPSAVVALVLRRAAMLVAGGVAAGTALALWASKFVAPLLFGLEPRDPLTLAGAAIVLSVVGGVAGWLPARRAARIDPATVLRGC